MSAYRIVHVTLYRMPSWAEGGNGSTVKPPTWTDSDSVNVWLMHYHCQ